MVYNIIICPSKGWGSPLLNVSHQLPVSIPLLVMVWGFSGILGIRRAVIVEL